LPNPVVKVYDRVVTKSDGTVDVSVLKNDTVYIYFGYPSWVDVSNSNLSIKIKVNENSIALNKKITIFE
jgi:hypothetical protein